MPIIQPVRNILGLKALAWNEEIRKFVSPRKNMLEHQHGADLDDTLVWTPGGLQQARCGRGMKHKVPDKECTCGLYSSYDLSIVDGYTDSSIISPIILVEASGRTVIHERGWRSAEMTVVMAGFPDYALPLYMRTAQQAADYFSVELQPMSTLIMIMDLVNMYHLSYYEPISEELSLMDRKAVMDMVRPIIVEES